MNVPHKAVGALTKNGSGTLTLTGNNSFTGAITVNEGQLSGLNPIPLVPAQQVIVKQGATLECYRKWKSLNQVRLDLLPKP